MNAIEAVAKALESANPGLQSRLRRPRKSDGEWWLDLQKSNHSVTIQWSSRRGFGVSASVLEDHFGDGPEETYRDAHEVLARAQELLSFRRHTRPPTRVLLRELRDRSGLTQQQVAAKLGVQQAAVSKLEGREDVALSSLLRFVEALDAKLEINVRMPTGEILPLLERELTAKPAMNLLVVKTRDLDRAHLFYSKLGLKLKRERHGAGAFHYSSDANGMIFELYPAEKGAGGMRFGLRIPDPSKALRMLVASGCVPREPPLLQRTPGPDVYELRDPDGNIIEIEG